MYPKNYYKAWHKSNTDFSSPVQMEINKLGTDSIMLFCSNVRHICYYHSRGIKPFFIGEMLTIDLSKYGRFVIPDGEVRSVYPKGVKRNKPSKKGLKLDSI